FSPDGSHVAFCRLHTVGTVQGTQIEIADAAGGNLRPLLQPSAANFDCYPSWSPDGRRLALWTDRLGPPGTGFTLATVNSDGTNLRRIAPSVNVVSTTGWSFDGAKVASAIVTPAPGVTPVVFKQFVGVVPATGGAFADPVPGVAESFAFAWSPHEEKLALSMVDQAGGHNYFSMLVNADGSSPIPIAPNVLSTGQPVWSPDGSRFLVAAPSPTPARTAWLFIARPDGSDGRPLLRSTVGAIIALWNPTARPGKLDGSAGAR